VKAIVTVLVSILLIAMLPMSAAAAGGKAALKGSVPPWATSANWKSSANASDPVNFRVYLSLRDQAKAEALAQAVSDPRSASYARYLTPAQFNQQFAPTSADVSAVSSWLQSQGFTVGYTPSNNHFVAAEGTVAQTEAAFGVSLGTYAVKGTTLRGNATELLVPVGIADAIAGVVGVDQSADLVTTMKSDGKDSAAPPSGGFRNSGPCSAYWAEKTTATTTVDDGITLPVYDGSARPFAPCGYAGTQLQSAYGVQSLIAGGTDGRGVTVAVIDAFASPTIVTDTSTYFARHGLPAWKSGQFTQVVPPGIYNKPETKRWDPQGWYGEETLDIEAVHTMAPGAKVVYVGSPNNGQSLDAALNHVVSARLADIVTNSYGWSTEALPRGFIKPYNDTMLQGVLEGIGIYFSSGDDGDETFGGPANTATADWPASSPYVTAVGGTSLAVGQNNAYLFETGWGTSRNRLNGTGFTKANGTNSWMPLQNEVYLYGSGGGTSRLFAQPSYQAGKVPAALATRWSSTPARVVPDISAVGDPNTGMRVGQTQQFSDGTYYDEYRIGGTSLSSPLMAGIMAVAQQSRGRRIGFANPLIYSLGAGIRDIVAPSSTVAVVRADFVNSENANDGILYSVRRMEVTFTLHTVAGYDDVTGLGTPNGSFVAAITSR
jgi:subtilase family serine protease